MSAPRTLGLFLGGRARRMGGSPKGLLPAPDTGEPIVVRTRALCEACGLAMVAVGEGEGYRQALDGVAFLRDAPAGIGPLGGLSALLTHAGGEPVLTAACDMPYLTASLIRRLATEPIGDEEAVLCPRDPATGLWQPLFARYVPDRVAPGLERALAEGERSFQRLFTRFRVRELPLDSEEWERLRDWDTPDDVSRGR